MDLTPALLYFVDGLRALKDIEDSDCHQWAFF